MTVDRQTRAALRNPSFEIRRIPAPTIVAVSSLALSRIGNRTGDQGARIFHSTNHSSFAMATLETRRFVVISTAHVSEATAKRLDSTSPKDWPCLGGLYGEYGWFLYAHDENAGVGPDAIPNELFNVMTWSRRQGFDYILFDCDADQVAELPAFDW